MPLDATFALGVVSLLIGQAVGYPSTSENLRRLRRLNFGQGPPNADAYQHHPADAPVPGSRKQLRRRRTRTEEVPHRCQRVPRHGCSICGPGLCVGNSHALLALPDKPAITCGYLQHAGYMGRLSDDHCDGALLSWIDICECGNGIGEMSGTPLTIEQTVSQSDNLATKLSSSPRSDVSETSEPTLGSVVPLQVSSTSLSVEKPVADNGPSTSASDPALLSIVQELLLSARNKAEATRTTTNVACPQVPEYGCSICGTNRCVGKPDAIFSLPGEPRVTCGQLEMAGYQGHIPMDQCSFLPSLIPVCECSDSAAQSSISTSDGDVPSVESIDEYPVSEDDTYIDLFASPDLADFQGNKNVDDPTASEIEDIESNGLSPVSSPTPSPRWI